MAGLPAEAQRLQGAKAGHHQDTKVAEDARRQQIPRSHRGHGAVTRRPPQSGGGARDERRNTRLSTRTPPCVPPLIASLGRPAVPADGDAFCICSVRSGPLCLRVSVVQTRGHDRSVTARLGGKVISLFRVFRDFRVFRGSNRVRSRNPESLQVRYDRIIRKPVGTAGGTGGPITFRMRPVL